MSNYFRYKKSFQIGYLGCQFHSLLELKYVLSIEDSHSFLREHIHIWYDPKTLLPTNYIRENTKKYMPDFLIRDKKDNSAYLVELKPRRFDNPDQLNIRTRVAENYIQSQNLDWKYKIIYDDEIQLSKEKYEKYKLLRSTVSSFGFKRKLEQRDKRVNSTKINFFKTVPFLTDMRTNDYIRFVKYGLGYRLNIAD